MKTLTTSTNPTAEDDRRLGRLRLQGLRLPLGLRPLLVGRRLGHNISPLLDKQLVLELEVREASLEVLQWLPSGLLHWNALPADVQLP
jgi:hypothetical protein